MPTATKPIIEKEGPPPDDIPRLFYVTIMKDRIEYAFLLGPYDTKEEADSHVGRGRDLAYARNPTEAQWCAYGTAGVDASTRQPTTLFGK